ncbi:MAG: FAD-binding protein [Thermodesulfobacteriota bacterium]
MNLTVSQLPGVDVLVLGSGFAGLRAAWGALERSQGAKVAVAAPMRGPSGSSFANINDRLGVQVPMGDAERTAFHREAMDLGTPGFVRGDLVAILADEAGDRFRELQALGLRFISDQDGGLRRFGSCFSPASTRAAVFTGLAAAYKAVFDHVSSRGGRFLPGMTAQALVQDPTDGRVLGALLEDRSGRPWAQPARSVVAAMGGPAPLFRYNQAGRGGTGYGHGMLSASGADMANTGYLQWMWARPRDRSFWPIWSLLAEDAAALDAEGQCVAVPGSVAEAAVLRSTHCPFGYGFPDAALDRFLLDQADALGVASIRTQGKGGRKERFQVALMAHAGNGGAVIDAHARTSVDGLYAVGECATGMHGANRMGGAMVLSCLVFGARAGWDAVEPGGSRGLGGRGFAAALARTMQGCYRDTRERNRTRRWLADLLQRKGLPRHGCECGDLASLLAGKLRRAVDSGAAHMLRTALCFARGRPRDTPTGTD